MRGFNCQQLLHKSKVFEIPLVRLTPDESHVLGDLVPILHHEDVLPQVLDHGLLEEPDPHLTVVLPEDLDHKRSVVSVVEEFQILTNGAGEYHG